MIRLGVLNYWTDWASESHLSPTVRTLAKLLGDDVRLVKDNPDIVVVSCFGDKRPTIKVPHIFVQNENPIDRPDYINKFGLPEIGWIDDAKNACAMPDWFTRFDELNNPRPIGERLNAICSMYRTAYNHREDIIYYHGAIRINAPDKISALSQYAYNIAVDNSHSPPYITEKLTDACVAGCIPIYSGGDLERTPFNRARILRPYCNITESPERLLHLPILSDNAAEMYEQRYAKLKRFLEMIL